MKKSLYFIVPIILLLSACKPDIEACFTASSNGLAITFAPSCSIEAVEFNWEFGDGETSIAENPTHIYQAAGTYTVTLRVADKKGRSNTVSETVVVVDPCPVGGCVNGTCVQGTCVCDTGYEGLNCSTPWNAKFNGTYYLTETCSASGNAGPYSVTISPQSGSIIQMNFQGIWEVPVGQVLGELNTGSSVNFTIARQPIMSGFEIESTNGMINANGQTINLTYTIYSTGSSTPADVCTATLTK